MKRWLNIFRCALCCVREVFDKRIETAAVFDPTVQGVYDLRTQGAYDSRSQGVYDMRSQSIYDSYTDGDEDILATYNPATHSIYDPSSDFLVPEGQSIFDPNVFGVFDLASQRVIPRTDDATVAAPNLDIATKEAQRFKVKAPWNLEMDRREIAFGFLQAGDGICLDACTEQFLPWVEERVAKLGFDYVPIDLFGKGKIGREDLTCLSYEDETISAIISLDTLEHVEGYEKAVSELYRVLKNDGQAIFHVPCYYFDKPESEPIKPGLDPWEHVRYFSARELLDCLIKAGFIILRVSLQLEYGAFMCVAAKNKEILALR